MYNINTTKRIDKKEKEYYSNNATNDNEKEKKGDYLKVKILNSQNLLRFGRVRMVEISCSAWH